jgi:hypothetical protein
MLYVNIHIDLPSEERLRRRTVLEWLASQIGRVPDLRSGEEVSTTTGLIVFKHVADAFEQVGVTDVLSVTVDRKPVYVDTIERSGDLPTAVAELQARRVLDKSIETMDVVFSHRVEGLHVLINVRLSRRVPVGQPELEIAFAARLEAMQIERGEAALAYAERLAALAGDPEPILAAREQLAALADAAKLALEQQFGDLVVGSEASPVSLRLIRPGARALDRFRGLSWGPMVRMPSYRPVPIVSRRGAYDEPFYHYYFDPYFDFVAWITLTEIVAGRGWRGLEFEVVDADGSRAFDHTNARAQAAVGVRYQGVAAPVRFEGEELVVDPAVPESEVADPAEIGDPRTVPGFGGGGWGDGGSGSGASCGAAEG